MNATFYHQAGVSTRRRRVGLIATVLVALTSLFLSACGNSSAGAGGKQVRLFMNPKFTGFPYFEVARAGGEKAAKELGDGFTYIGSDKADVSEQVRALQNAITQKPSALVVSAIDQNAVAPALKQARQRGIKVVTYDADAATPARDIFVNQLSYELAAKTMLDAALANDPSGGKVAFIAASPTATNHMAHIKFMRQLIATDPKYKVFKPLPTIQYAGDDETKSFNVAVNLMQAVPDLKYIISSSAVSVPAAAKAIVSQGKQGKVYATGFALPSAMKQYIADGSNKAFALWDPNQLGYVATVVADKLARKQITTAEGTKVDAGTAGTYTIGKDGEIDINKPIIFTKDNIGEYNF